MRFRLGMTLLIATAGAALADTSPVLVIPGRPGISIIINGIDASYAVVEGDWGLSKNTHVTPTVYGGRVVEPVPPVGHYYPSLGREPGYGRLEIEPPLNRTLPQPAESYHQSWSSQSTPQPVQPEVPFYPPPIIVAPQNGMPGDFDRGPQDFQHQKPRKSSPQLPPH